MNNINDKSKDKSSYSSDESRATKNGKGDVAAPDKNAKPNGQTRYGKQASPHEKDEEDRDRTEY